MTTQDLKNNRNEIISRIIELGCEDKMQSFMEIMILNVDFFKGSDVMDFVYETYSYSFSKVSRKVNQVAEASAKAVEEGRKESFDINEYYKNK